MRTTFLPFSRPSISEDDIAAVDAVLRSGWITTGPKCAEFENRFGEYVGSKGAVALASATGGMHLLIEALGIGSGDEVITPAMTWVSTVNLAVLSGARPVFVDVDRDTLMVSADAIEAALTSRTRLIVPVHFAGAAADMAPIRRLAAQNGISLAEDAAHAFHPIKNITTGEGGMLCSDDPALLDRIRRLKFHGLGADAFERETRGRSPQAQVQEPGFKYNLTDIGAVLGLGQLARVDVFNRRREELALTYRERLSGIDEILPLADPTYPMAHSWHLFVVRLDVERAGISRNEFMERLKERNIGTGIHFLAVHLQRYYRESMGTRRGMLPNTEWNSDRICSLPLFPDMTPEDVEDVVDAIKDVLKK
ncbi:MAG: aminotransferase class I/II-fold pyridoxal phosphate-dependent enzyme [Desulfuromonadales bacterium]